jgi:hypothetical protein
MTLKNIKFYFILIALVSVPVFVIFAGDKFFGNISYSNLSQTFTATSTIVEVPMGRKTTHIKTPIAVKGIYMTSCVASRKDLRANLLKLVDETELNAIVLDIKTYDGRISFPVESEILKPAEGGGCFVPDLQDFIDELHAKNIYVIGRIAVFQDVFMVGKHPERAVKKSSDKNLVWKDYKGIPWMDAGGEDHWKYISELGHESWKIGFDELNFDYIRFPSDGNMKDIYYPFSDGKIKSSVMESFFSYLHGSFVGKDVKISADLFGMVTTNPDDLNIGQILEKALPYFDYIAPMVYPSHYPNNAFNLGDPNKHPYEIVNHSMEVAVARTISTTTQISTLLGKAIASTTPKLYTKESFDRNKLRPWLQDNNYPVPYTADMVKAQIQATYDAGLNSWMLWNAGNRYTREALLTE